MRPTNYLGVLALGCLALGALVVAFNLVIDPYGYFRLVSIPGVNAKKPRPDLDMVGIKTAGVRAIHPDALILGNSRAEIGFDPEHPAFAHRGLSAYNFAIPGSDLGTTWRQLRSDGDPLRPRLIVLGLDFQDFLVDPKVDGGDAPDPAPQGTAAALRTRFQALYTLTGLYDSLTTLLVQSQPYAATLTARGFNPLRDYIAIARIDGWHALFAQKADGVARALVSLPHAVVAQSTGSSPALRLLRRIVRTAIAQGTDLTLVIYPYHAQLLLLYDAAGLWPAFEEWKRQVAAVVADEAAAATGPGRVSLWDFSGFHAYAREAVPGKDDRVTELRWYWEPAHFRKELGDIILSRVLDGTDAPDGFGMRLTPQNVEQAIDAARAGRDALKQQEPAMAREASELMARAYASARRREAIAAPTPPP